MLRAMAQGDGRPKDRPDDLDRINAPASRKLEMLCAATLEKTGQDPRGGGWSFVGRPGVIKALLAELPPLFRKMRPKIVVSRSDGKCDSDVIFDWSGVPVRMRHNVTDNGLWALRNEQLPPSTNHERREAARVRWEAWSTESNLVLLR